MDVKKAFNHVFRAKLAEKMADFNINDNFINLFLAGKSVKLVINRFTNLKQK